jgi:hypothetical protein
MGEEEWESYIHELESEDEIAQAFRTLFNKEREDLHAALRADKWVRPGNREQRIELMRGIREVRTRRVAELLGAATVRRAEKLVNEIYEALRQEVRA